MASSAPSPIFPIVGEISAVACDGSTVEWIIVDFLKLTGTVRSLPFSRTTCAGVSKWSLQLNTKVAKDGKEYVGVFVELVEKQALCEYLVTCIFSMGSNTQKPTSFRFDNSAFASAGKTFGFPTFVSRQLLSKEYLVTENLTVQAKVDVVQTKEACTIHDDMKRLLLDERYSDFTLRSKDDNRELKVYKGLLALHSTVFERLIESTMKETLNKLLEIPFSYSTMRDMVQYIYTGSMPAESSAKDLFEAADMYHITGLRERCLTKLCAEVCIEDVCEVLILSDLCKEPELRKKCIGIIVKNPKLAQETAGWKSLREHDELYNEVFLACTTVGKS